MQNAGFLTRRLTCISVQQSIELLSRAKKPLILLGSQATLPPVPVEELRKSLEVSEYVIIFPYFLINRSRADPDHIYFI